MPTTHYLKCDASQFDAIERGDKNFEVRKDDRAYQAGDTLVIDRLNDSAVVAEQKLMAHVTYVLRGGQYGVEYGYVVLALSAVRPAFLAR